MNAVLKVDTAADPADLWRAVIEIDDWPQWTESVTSIERLDDGPLRVGSRVRVKQPKLPSQVWQVSELTEGRSFTWEVRSPGVVTVGGHVVTPRPDGASLELTVRHKGLLAGLVGLLTSGLTRRNVALEAAGLKARGEKLSGGDKAR